jgi:hypothetical protein
MNTETLFTDIYTTRAWGSKESVSGPSSTHTKTVELRNQLPSLFSRLSIQSIFDCGCGDFNWFQHVSLGSIQYIGADIVEPIIKENQQEYTTSTIHFQKMDCLTDPPETADLWIVRDMCGLYSYESIRQLLLRFIESNSNYIAFTTFPTHDTNIDGSTGILRPLNIQKAPFLFPDPIDQVEDGQQWFRKKFLYVYTRDQLVDLPFLTSNLISSSIVIDQWNMGHGIQGMHGNPISNVPLRYQSLHGHKA